MRNLLTMNVLMYVLLFASVVIVYLIEKRDWICTNSYDLWKACSIGDGMPFRGSKPEKSDDCKTLLKKINIAASAERSSIKWRRSFVLGAVISILLYGLVVTPGSLPIWMNMYVAVIIAFSVLYFNMNYYSYHRFKKPQEYIKESTELINEKIGEGRC